jgi:hypothetical protein
MGTTLGIDTWSSCVANDTTLPCLQAGGTQFIGRYYSSLKPPAGTILTSTEATVIAAEYNLQSVAIYQDDPTSYSYFTVARANDDALAAQQQASAAEQPTLSAIYFSVGYDASESEIEGNIKNYFEGILSLLMPDSLLGVYGSGATCAGILAAGWAKYAWLAQDTGWSGYADFTNWSIKQGSRIDRESGPSAGGLRRLQSLLECCAGRAVSAKAPR